VPNISRPPGDSRALREKEKYSEEGEVGGDETSDKKEHN